MSSSRTWSPALKPEDLADFFIARANAGDADGLAALYEPDAVLVGPNGERIAGRDAIRSFYAGLLQGSPPFQPGSQRRAVINGSWALTSSRLVSGIVTAEVAHEQPDGSWLWVIDQPAIAKEAV